MLFTKIIGNKDCFYLLFVLFYNKELKFIKTDLSNNLVKNHLNNLIYSKLE